MKNRKKHFLSLFILSLVIGVGYQPSCADQREANLRAIQAAAKALEAAQQARKAQETVNQAVEAAQSAANEAQELGYQAYLDLMSEWRSERLRQMPLPPQPPTDSQEIHHPIDAFISAKWPKDTFPALCDDSTFIRRVYLDVVGYIPPAEKARTFLSDSDPAKRETLIDYVLALDEDYAVHWSQFWEDALCSNGNHQGGVGTRGNFQQFIIDSFKENKPYDVFVAQLIDPGAVKYRGGYVKSETHLDSLQTAANLGQVFLGTRMKCASCHDHFLNYEWTQNRFFGFASFFSDKNLEIIRCEVKKGEFVAPQFIFENGQANPDRLTTLEGRLSEVTQLIIDPANPRFAAAMVNRLWKRYLGLGFIEPVDDMREDTPASHPELLQWLSYEFAKSGYDMKHMIRLMLNSRTYQLEFNPQLADIQKTGETSERLFRSPIQRRLTCEQVLDSIHTALAIDTQRTDFDKISTPLSRSLGRPETRNEPITTRSEDVAILQALELINGETLNQLIYESPMQKKLKEVNPVDQAIEEAFISVLSRFPRPDELQQTHTFLQEDQGETGWGDMLWALIASPEFQYIL